MKEGREREREREKAGNSESNRLLEVRDNDPARRKEKDRREGRRAIRQF